MTPRLAHLTDREEAVLALWRLPDKQIAHRLGISVRTVNSHWRNILVKTDTSCRADAAEKLAEASAA